MNKKIKYFIIYIFVLILFVTPLICFAEKANIISKPISTPEINIDEVIKENVTKELVNEWYEMNKLFEPVTYYYDLTNYLLEYNVSIDFWKNVLQFDYEGLINQIDYRYPTIYIPICAEIEDTMKIKQERVIGNIILKYNALKDQYTFRMMLYNLNSTGYLNKNFMGSFEKIQDYSMNNNVDIDQVFLIKYPTASSTDDERIAVVKTKTDAKILDVSNSLQINEENLNNKTNVYTIQEYSVARKIVEKYLYQESNSLINNPSGGNNINNNDINSGYGFEKNIVCLLSGLVVIGIIIIFVIRKNKVKKYHK